MESCRICHEKSGNMIKPCNCQENVHGECLKDKIERENFYYRDDLICNICQSQYVSLREIGIKDEFDFFSDLFYSIFLMIF